MDNDYYLNDSMRKSILIFVGFLIISCANNAVQKPDNLIERDVMVDILYDITVIQSANNFSPATFSQNDIKVNEIIYKKYNIDSASFAQSNRYYASDPHKYQKMFKKVSERIDAERTAINEKYKKQTGRSISPSDAPAIQ